MPVGKCRSKGRSGYKWGEHGKCYLYISNNKRSRKAAYEKATLQGKAIRWRQHTGGLLKTATIKKLFNLV